MDQPPAYPLTPRDNETNPGQRLYEGRSSKNKQIANIVLFASDLFCQELCERVVNAGKLIRAMFEVLPVLFLEVHWTNR